VRGVRGVAEQHDVAVHPSGGSGLCGTAASGCVAEQSVSLQLLGEVAGVGWSVEAFVLGDDAAQPPGAGGGRWRGGRCADPHRRHQAIVDACAP
jgi:hypothetical protein